MKIYTKKGDKGSTSLFGGQTVPKSSTRIHAYGTVDELNSVLGIVLAHPHDSLSKKWLIDIQHQLFVLGADLATPHSKDVRIDRISENEITYLEAAIDEIETKLSPLKNFILPGGTKSAATLHLARTVCRRAERITVECLDDDYVSEFTIKYLNRLSDFLFMLARFENLAAGKEDTPWIPK